MAARKKISPAQQIRLLKQEVSSLKKSASWGRLFAMAQEYKLFGDSVTRPYEQISSVYKAIKAIADNVPQADLKFRVRGSKKEIESDPIIDLFSRPNPMMSETDLIQAWVGFQCLYGEAMIVKTLSVGQAAGTSKLPAQLWAFNPAHFDEMTQGRDIVGWRYSQENISFTREEVIHTKDFNPYSLFRGMAPTKAIDKMIDIDYQSLIYNKAFFDNDARPGMILSTDEELGEDVVKRVLAQFKANHQGASKAFRVALLESGLKPDNVGPTHKDMDFIEQKKYTREEILGIWRAPKALFNITEDLNYATFIGQMKIFWSYAIMPVMKKVESAINAQLVWPYNPKIEAYFDYSNVVAYQEDLKEKVATAVQLHGIGFTRNEINKRLELGFDDVPWGNVWWAPFGVRPIDSAEEEAAELDPAEPDPEDPQDAPQPDDNPKDKPEAQKPAKMALNPKREALWKGFLSKQSILESRMAGGISKYFLEQRKTVLKALSDRGEGFVVDWADQNEKLKNKAEKYLHSAVREGIDFGRTVLGRKSLSDDMFDARVSAFLKMRTDKITAINQTIQKQLKLQLSEGIAAGETVMQLSDRVRDIYNMASGRSIMIARTETVGAVNGGSQMYYESEGVQKKEWLTAHDEHVRDSHQALEGQVRSMNDDFGNGLEYPGDQKGNPSETINCRCSLLPVIE